jgi:hypothetical protein
MDTKDELMEIVATPVSGAVTTYYRYDERPVSPSQEVDAGNNSDGGGAGFGTGFVLGGIVGAVGASCYFLPKLADLNDRLTEARHNAQYGEDR